MTDQERKLLLSVARLLRAHLGAGTSDSYASDLQSLDDALAPFEPNSAVTTETNRQ